MYGGVGSDQFTASEKFAPSPNILTPPPPNIQNLPKPMEYTDCTKSFVYMTG